MRRVLVGVTLLISSVVLPSAQASAPPAKNVVVITIDGFRWQEMFGGPAPEYFKKDSKGQSTALEREYTAGSASDRRTRLLPFMWKTIAANGQIFGDPAAGSLSHVTNGLWFSYPGYNEMFSGAPDSRIDSNKKVPNPNVTVLEWLNSRPGFAGRVAAFGAWDVLPSIVNANRSKIPVGTGFSPVVAPKTAREREINEFAKDLPKVWDYGTLDAPVVYAAIDSLRTAKPRVLYLMLGEGDEWAHESRYDLYLDASVRADRFIERVWNVLQSLPNYRGTTALIVTTDHGRGATPKDWSDHGTDVPAGENTWFAAMGAGVPALGVRKNLTVTTSQLAATIASLLGEDFQRAKPSAADPLPLK
jgi:hypothetical protein